MWTPGLKTLTTKGTLLYLKYSTIKIFLNDPTSLQVLRPFMKKKKKFLSNLILALQLDFCSAAIPFMLVWQPQEKSYIKRMCHRECGRCDKQVMLLYGALVP